LLLIANPPPQIPDHTLLRPIGRGAYGEVWLARNVMGVLRAVKIIWRRDFDNQRPYDREFAGIQRYEPVSRSSTGLVHMLHVGRNDAEGYFFYVMELADGAEPQNEDGGSRIEDGRPITPERPSCHPLSSILDPLSYTPRTLRSDLKRLERLSTVDCLRLALDVVGGLAELHRHGLVHRDVKPGNIIYVQGRAKLADIGLVSAGDEGRTFVGTEGYIPPEGPGTPGADLYALGVALYEASTGNPPEKFPDVPAQWLAEEAENGALEFHEIVLKACEGQRERRYPNAEAMQADVALLQSGQSLRRVRALERRYARLRLSGIVGTALLVCALGTAFFANYRARLAAESRAKEALLREQAQTSLVRAESAERDARQQLYTALLGEARATVLSRELGQRVRALEAVRRASTISNSAELRGAAIAALALPDLRFDRELPTTPDMTLLRLDPAFARIALCRGRGPVEIRSVADNSLITTLPASTNLPAYLGLWSPDGRFLAVGRDYPQGELRDMEIWEVSSGQRKRLFHGLYWGAFSFHPHLPRIIVGQSSATAIIWDLESGEEVRPLSLARTAAVSKFSPEGDRFAELHTASNRWVAAVHRSRDAETLASYTFTNAALDLNWDPNGRWISIPDYSGTISLMDAQTGDTRILGRHKAEATVAEFSPDGGYLFSGGWDRELICWDLKSMQRALTIDLDSYHIQFSGDGGRCAVLRWPEIRLRLYWFDLPMLHREFSEDLGGRRNSAAFSPDGRWLAVSGGDAAAVWDLSGSGPGAMAPEAKGARVAFAPNGELFAHRWEACFRWHPRPGADSTAAPELEPLEINKPERFDSLSPTSFGVVLTSGQGSKVTAYNRLAADTNAPVRTESGPSRVSPDGRWLGIHRAFMPYLEVYRLPGLEHVARLTNHAAISTIEFSPTGNEVAVASRAGVEFWSTANWQPLRYLTNFTDILYSADGRTLWLSTGMLSAGLYDARTLEPILPLPVGTLPLAHSPDGRYLAVRADARRVELWDLAQVRDRLRELGLDWGR
jgi:WD40 repeat protein